jgi:hypothetical protein
MRLCLLIGSILAAPLGAATVSDFALGSTLAGATVDVIRVGGVHSPATFVADGTGAIASAVGSTGFTLTVSAGDTSAATWTLTNTDPALIFLNRITAVTIDLTLSSIALFDDGSSPSTPVSGPGIAGVTYVGGITIGGAGEFAAWSDPANTGDMFRALTITFDGGFTTGASSSWMDDTDVIGAPEPGSMVLMAPVGLALAAMRARRRRRLADRVSD